MSRANLDNVTCIIAEKVFGRAVFYRDGENIVPDAQGFIRAILNNIWPSEVKVVSRKVKNASKWIQELSEMRKSASFSGYMHILYLTFVQMDLDPRWPCANICGSPRFFAATNGHLRRSPWPKLLMSCLPVQGRFPFENLLNEVVDCCRSGIASASL